MNKQVFVIIVIVAVFIFVILYFKNRLYKLVTGYEKTWDSGTDAVIATLDKRVQLKWSQFINDLDKNHNIRYKLVSGRRTFAEQAVLHDKYLAGGAKAAPPGQSYHNYGLATDGYITVNGRIPSPLPAPPSTVIEVAKKYGLSWGGNFGDPPHFEYKGFGSESQLLALYNAGKAPNGYLVS